VWPFIVILCLLIVFIMIGNHSHRKSLLITYPKRQANITFFSNGKKMFDHYFKDIQGAKQFIFISFFIVKNDAHSLTFLKRLQEKSESGVDVYLLVDRLGSLFLKKEWIHNLEQSGVHFLFSRRWRLLSPLRSLNRRNHRKITVIDGDIGYIGGLNVGDEYVNDSRKFAGWKDYHMRVVGEVVADFFHLFRKDWEVNGGEKINMTVGEPEAKGESTCQLVPTSGGSLEDVFIHLINKAEHSIKIGTPYFIPSERLMKALLEKRRDGVHITIIYPDEADHPFVKEASIPYLKRLVNAGGEVYLFTKGFYHAKILFIDDKLVDIGTANFDRRSLFINDEVNLLIYDQPIIEIADRAFHNDLEEALPLNDEWLNAPNKFVAGIKKVIATILKPLM